MAGGRQADDERDDGRSPLPWLTKFVLRVSKLERGRAYDLTVILPEGDADPMWIVRGGARVENGQ